MQQLTKRLTLPLAFSQLLNWGTLYYSFAVLAPSLQRDTSFSTALLYGAVAWSLCCSAFFTTAVASLLQKYGGKAVLIAGAFCSTAGLALLAFSYSAVLYMLAWTLLGLAMALSLYETAFATLTQYISSPRQAMTTITLVGGLASSVFWPLTSFLMQHLHWQQILYGYAALHLLLALPLFCSLPGTHQHIAQQSVTIDRSSRWNLLSDPGFLLLALAFACGSLIFAALSLLLFPLLQQQGYNAEQAGLWLSCIGVVQVLSRLLELKLLQGQSASILGYWVFSALAAGVALLLLSGSAPALTGFILLYGFSNGVITLVRGQLPLLLYPHLPYPKVASLLAAPGTMAKALGPLCLAFFWQPAAALTLVWILIAFAVLALLMYHLAINKQHRNQKADRS